MEQAEKADKVNMTDKAYKTDKANKADNGDKVGRCGAGQASCQADGANGLWESWASGLPGGLVAKGG